MTDIKQQGDLYIIDEANNTLTVDSANTRVGIGNNSPGHSLSVTGDGNFTANLSAGSNLFLVDAGSNSLTVGTTTAVSGNVLTVSGASNFSDTITAAGTGNSLTISDTLRIAQTGSGLRMTNVGAFDNDGSDNFRVFGSNDLILAANGETGTAITIDATNQDVAVSNDLSITGTTNVSTLTDGTLSISGGIISSSTLASPIITGVIALNSNSTTVPPLTLTASSLNDGVGALRIDSVEPDIYLNDTNGGFTTVTFANNDTASAAFGRNSSDDFYITVTTDGSTWRNDTFVVDHDTGDIAVGYKFNVGTGDLQINGTDITATATELNQLDGVTLGTAASSNVGDFATAAQGATADTALQIVAVDGSTITGDGTPGNPLVAAGGGGGISIGDSVGSGTSGSILFVDASTNLAQDNGELYWDNTNNRLGIGTTSPSAAIEVDAGASTEYAILSTGANGRVGLTTQYGGIHINNVEGTADLWQLSERDTAQFDIAFGTPDSGNNVAATDTQFRITNGGNVGIGLGSTNPSQKLHVSGTIRQTNSTSAVLVSDGNGDIGSASNLQDVSYYQARPPEPPGPGEVPAIGNWFLPSPVNFVGWIDIGGFFVPAFQ